MPWHGRNGNCDPRGAKQLILESPEKDLEKTSQRLVSPFMFSLQWLEVKIAKEAQVWIWKTNGTA